jgi:L-asparaginase / beta-aspartyl-peptidase
MSTRRPATALFVAAAAALAGACAPGAVVVSTPPAPASQAVATGPGGPVIVIHGGAGTILREQVSPELEAELRQALEAALQAGYAVLVRGGSSLDAVELAVRSLEDSPHFNAGRGAVFTAEGTIELDASIMDGRTLAAGAVAGVMRVRNPISLARVVMERSPHVFMAREGAEVFAREHGLELVDPSWFFTQRRWDALQRARQAEQRAGGGSAALGEDWKLGTVGALALDRQGNLAAATSTGGLTNKRFGRIGDVPIIGAGNYADNRVCAVSATGQGEYFIRNVVAYDICARARYTGVSLRDAAHAVVMQVLVEQRGEGGVITLDPHGNISMPFNTPGMYRGYLGPDGRAVVELYRD